VKAKLTELPREFSIAGVEIKEYGRIELAENEMITMVSESGRECDFTSKEWGFYLAPSINGRLRDQGFKVALVRNQAGKLFINAVEVNKMDLFKHYVETEQKSTIVCWLDEWAD
jgi:hypothetical protein